MAPEIKSKLGLVATSFGAAATIFSVIFFGGGFYSQTKTATGTAIPALDSKLENHIRIEETFKSNVIDVLNEIKIEMKVNKQAFDDLKDEVRNGNQKTIKAIKEQ